MRIWKRLNYNAFVRRIAPHSFYSRAKSDLSKDYWRHVTGEPTAKRTGLGNIAYLGAGQLSDAAKDYSTMYALDTIWQKQYHTMFHDYRKLLRAINFVGLTYVGMWKGGVAPKQLATVGTAFSKFGKVNDLVAQYAFFKSKADKKNQAKKRDQIVDAWKALRKWLDTNNFKALLGQLQAALIAH